MCSVAGQTAAAGTELREGQKQVCVEERGLTAPLGEIRRYVRVYTVYELQDKPLPSAPGQSGSLTASQTGLTAPFNPTNNSLLTGAFLPDFPEHVLTQQGAI